MASEAPSWPLQRGHESSVGFTEASAFPGHWAQSQTWETRRQEGPEALSILPCSPSPSCPPLHPLSCMKINEVRFPSTSDLEGWRGWGGQPTDTHVRPEPYFMRVMRLLGTQMMGTGLISGHQDSRVRQNFTGGGVGWGRGVNFRTRGEKDHTDHERRRGA